MAIIWIVVAGVIPSICAKLFLPAHDIGRLFILGLSGAGIAGVMQYSERQPIGFLLPFLGACALLAVYAVTTRTQVEETRRHDDYRKAA
jgi:uncharacterized membrane protein YeaQ/YmgE (transglycosylase-associated protein family)